MRKITRRIISVLLVLTMLFLATVPTFAEEREEYLSDLRLIYADSYDEAKEILAETDFDDYKILNANLNKDTGKSGVWLAYQTTTNIDDAITDIAVMQMNGGYQEGNYQAMIQQSYAEYLEFGENYLSAIEYFNKGYDAGHYLSKIAHRQLNFYNVVTEGIDDIPEFEGERIGDIFYNGIDVSDLATIFMEGNSYALDNIRSLIAMGVSYNEDGKTYLERVGAEVEKLKADSNLYAGEDYNDLATLIAPVISVFRDMFKELEAYESELNYNDEEFTDLEIQYLEYMTLATMMRSVNYLGDKTLYDFCLNYTGSGDNSNLYPLVAAMNEGQIAMTYVNHYYDVVRYSVTLEQDTDINAELDELEKEYATNPCNIYAGVDRTIFRDTFALTSDAYRSDAFTESGLAAQLTGGAGEFGRVMNTIGIVGASIFGSALIGHGITKAIVNKYNKAYLYKQYMFFNRHYFDADEGELYSSVIDDLFKKLPGTTTDQQNKLNVVDKYAKLKEYYSLTLDIEEKGLEQDLADFNTIEQEWTDNIKASPAVKTAKAKAETAQQVGSKVMGVVYAMYVVGGLMTLASAIRLGYEIYNYYHPTYDDIPTAMVDLIDTPDGDRYIKYDVVYEAEHNKDGGYSAADLNAFSANRWNALYYTKSYEAGKPLLADEFVVSNNNNIPDNNYAPVHRFGEVVSFNLNKYNFNETYSIYLSVKQSENQKSAVAGVPEIVGSVFSAGKVIISCAIGICVGIGGTVATKELIKKRKTKIDSEAKETE